MNERSDGVAELWMGVPTHSRLLKYHHHHHRHNGR